MKPFPAAGTAEKPDPSAVLVAEVEALRNDAIEAQKLAEEYQRQLYQKTKDIADLITVLRKAFDHILELRRRISELERDGRFEDEVCVAHPPEQPSASFDQDFIRVNFMAETEPEAIAFGT